MRESSKLSNNVSFPFRLSEPLAADCFCFYNVFSEPFIHNLIFLQEMISSLLLLVSFRLHILQGSNEVISFLRKHLRLLY